MSGWHSLFSWHLYLARHKNFYDIVIEKRKLAAQFVYLWPCLFVRNLSRWNAAATAVFFLGTVTALLVPSPMARSTKRRIRMALELKSYPLIHCVQFARAQSDFFFFFYWGKDWRLVCSSAPFFPSSIDPFAMSAPRIIDSTCEFTQKLLISLISFCFAYFLCLLFFGSLSGKPKTKECHAFISAFPFVGWI